MSYSESGRSSKEDVAMKSRDYVIWSWLEKYRSRAWYPACLAMLIMAMLLVCQPWYSAHAQYAWPTQPNQPAVYEKNKVVFYEGWETATMEKESGYISTLKFINGWANVMHPKGKTFCGEYLGDVYQWTITNRGGVPGGDATTPNYTPGAAALGTKNCVYLMYNGASGVKISTSIVSPRVSLNVIEEPVLVFQYAQKVSTGGHDKLVVEYCTKNTSDAAVDGNKEADWNKLTEISNYSSEWTKVAIMLTDSRYGSLKDQSDVRFRFRYVSGGGGGIAVDEFMLVDAAETPVVFSGSPNYQMLSYPVGQGSEYTPISRLFFELATGGGSYRLDGLKMKLEGQDLSVVKALYLYKANGRMLPSYNAKQSALMGELEVGTDGTISGFKSGTRVDANCVFTSGEHMIFIVADIQPTAALGKRFVVSVPDKESWVFTRCKDSEGTTEAIADPDGENVRKFPIDESLWKVDLAKDYTSVYNTLFSDHFANGIGQWVSKPVKGSTNFLEKTDAQQAWRGDKMASIEGIKAGDVTDFVLKNAIDILNYRDIRLNLKWRGDLAAGSFSVWVCDEKEELNTQVNELASPVSNDGWVQYRVPLSRLIHPDLTKIKIKIRAAVRSQQGTLYIDDVNVIGDKVNNDLAVISITQPEGLVHGASSVFKVKVRNNGVEPTPAGAKIKLQVGGEAKFMDVPVGLTKGQEQELSFSGFTNLVGSTEESVNNLFSVVATVEWALDQEPLNNVEEGIYIALARYVISKNREYPPKVTMQMPQWYPMHKYGTKSWVRRSARDLAKSQAGGNGPLVGPFGVGMYHGYDIWTTGKDVCNPQEESYLVSPLFELQDADVDKQLFVRYAKTKGVALLFEYRTKDDPEWKPLPSTNTSYGNWYADPSKGWDETTGFDMGTGSYQTAKVVFPIREGLIQVRALFMNKLADNATTGGVAFNALIVRPPRPDLEISKIEPVAECGKPIGSAPVKLTVKNAGYVDATQATLGDGVVVNGKVQVPLYLEIYKRKAALAAGGNVDSVLVESATEIFEYSVPFAKETELTFTSKIRRNWDDYSQGYVIRATLVTEELGLQTTRDEDVGNNIIQKVLISKGGASHPVKGLIPVKIADSEYAYYYQSDAKITPILETELSNGYLKYSDYKWTTPSGSNAKFTQGASNGEITVTDDGKLDFSYTLTECDGQGTPLPNVQPCVVTLHIDVKKGGKQLKVLEVLYTDQEKPSELAGCYRASGEKVKVKVKNNDATLLSNVEVVFMVDGELLQTVGTISNLAANAEVVCEVSGVKIPSGQSNVVVFAREKGEAGPLNFSENSMSQALFRLQAEDKVQVFLRAGSYNDAQKNVVYSTVKPLPFTDSKIEGLSSMGGDLHLWVVRNPGMTVGWKKSEDGGKTWTELQPVTENNIDQGADYLRLPLGVEAIYRAVVNYGNCGGTKESAAYSLIAKDLSVEGLMSAEPYCSDGVKKPMLKVTLQNKGYQYYEEGTKLEFSVKYVAKNLIKNYEIALPFPIGPGNYVNLDVAPMEVPGDVNFGVNTVDVTLLKVDGVEESNSQNNSISAAFELREAPKVVFDPAIISKVFPSDGSERIVPTVEKGLTSYEWFFRETSDMDWVVVPGSGSSNVEWTVSGVPANFYRIRVTGSNGCTNDAVREYRQTNLELTRFQDPSANACEFATDQPVKIVLRNSGSKPIPAGTKITVTLSAKIPGASVPSVSIDEIIQSKLEVGKDYILRTSYPDFFGKLSKGAYAKLEAKLKMDEPVDVIAADDKASLSVRMLGKPDLSLSYDSQGDGVYVPIVNGSTIKRFSFPVAIKSTFEKNIGDKYTFAWKFMPSKNLIPSDLEVVISSDDLVNGSHEEKLPNQKALDIAKATPNAKVDASGWYQVLASHRLSPQCYSMVEFALHLDKMNLKLEEVVAPVSACKIEDAQLLFKILNDGTVDIPKTKFRLKAKITDDNDMPLVDANGKPISFAKLDNPDILEDNFPKGGRRTMSLPIPELEQVKDGTRVKISDVMFEIVENSNPALYKFDDPADNKYDKQPYFLVDDFKGEDPYVLTMEAGSNKQNNVSQEVPFTYDTQGEIITVRESMLDVFIANGGKIEWMLDPGMSPVNNFNNTSVPIQFTGTGDLKLKLTDRNGCSSDFYSYRVQLNGVDFTLVADAMNDTCFDILPAQIPVNLTLKNVGKGALSFAQSYGIKIPVSYTLKQGNTPIVGPVSTTVDFSRSSDNDFVGGAELKSGKDAAFPALTSIDKSKLTDPAHNYSLELLVEPDKAVNKDGDRYSGFKDVNPNNNKITIPLKYYIPSNKLKAENLGVPDEDGNRIDPLFDDKNRVKVYGGCGVLAVINPAERAKYTDYKWSKDGVDLSYSPCSTGMSANPLNTTYVTVKDPGTYRITFTDEHGCRSFGEQEVRFPGFLTLVSESVRLEKDVCQHDPNEPILFKVKNVGREDVTLSLDKPLPMGFLRLVSASAPLDSINTSPNVCLGTPKDPNVPLIIKPGEEQEITLHTGNVVMPSEFSASGEHKVKLLQMHEVPLNGKTYRIEDWDFIPDAYKNPIWYTKTFLEMPPDPDLEGQLNSFLTAANVDMNLYPGGRIPRDMKLTLDASKGVASHNITHMVYKWEPVGNLKTDTHQMTVDRTVSQAPMVFRVTTIDDRDSRCVTNSKPLTCYFEKGFKFDVQFGENVKKDSKKGLCAEGDRPEDLKPIVDVLCKVEYADTAFIDQSLGAKDPLGILVDVTITSKAGTKTYSDILPLRGSYDAGSTISLKMDASKFDPVPLNEKFNMDVKLTWPTSYYKEMKDKVGEDNISVQDLFLKMSPKVKLIDIEPGKPKILRDVPNYLLKAEVTNLRPGATYTYYAGPEVLTAFEKLVDLNDEVIMKAEDDGCVGEASANLTFQHKVEYAILYGENLGSVTINDASKTLANGEYVNRGSSVTFTITPEPSAVLDQLVVAGEPLTPSGIAGEVERFDEAIGKSTLRVEVGFSEGDNGSSSTPVVSDALARVIVISPFVESLRLVNTMGVSRVELYNQLGSLLLVEHNSTANDQLLLPASNLVEGYYILRLYDRDGTSRVIPVIKQR